MGTLLGFFRMKLVFVILAALVCLAAATTYTKIDQKTCTDSSCSSCQNDGDFPTNQCLRSSAPGYFLLVNCSTDGTQLYEYAFQDSSCSGPARGASIKTDTCTPVAGGGYAEWTCVAGALASDEALPPRSLLPSPRSKHT